MTDMSVSRDQAEAAGLNSITADQPPNQPVNPTPNPMLANPSFYTAPPLVTDAVQRQSTSGTVIPPSTSATVGTAICVGGCGRTNHIGDCIDAHRLRRVPQSPVAG